MDPVNLTVDRWCVLKLIEEAGGQLTVARMLKVKPTLTRIVDLLVKAGLVLRFPDQADRRRIRWQLTDAGGGRVHVANALVESLRVGMSRGLTKQGRTDLARVLGRINANNGRACGEA